jgi:hypothetical protein
VTKWLFDRARVRGAHDIVQLARMRKKLFLISSCIILAVSGPSAAASPLGDFFQKIGRSISHLRKSPPTSRNARNTATRDSGSKTDASTSKEKVGSEVAPSATPTAKPMPTPVDIRPAAIASPDRGGRRDVPYGVAVPNKPGLVTSPYAPTQGYVDVRGFPSSTEVMDPYTGKIFRTP